MIYTPSGDFDPPTHYSIMEYGSTPYVGMAQEKKRTKSYVQNSALIIVIGFYDPYHDISSVFISNKTVSGSGKLRWSTTPASRYTGGAGRNGLILLCFFSQASTIMAEAITMIQARTS